MVYYNLETIECKSWTWQIANEEEHSENWEAGILTLRVGWGEVMEIITVKVKVTLERKTSSSGSA